MAHKITFYPEGNADTCLVESDSGGMLLFDFADRDNPDDPENLKFNLTSELREKLEASGRTGFDVVAFTHLDDDHIDGATEFFSLWHASKYQGEGRAEIGELWVPAGAITEPNLKPEAAAIRQEARHRLRKGEGIRVFSRPERLEEWLAGEGLDLGQRDHLITDAGQLVHNYTKEAHSIEFFSHSPFAHRQDGHLHDRNEHSLVLQVVFEYGGKDVRMLLSADSIDVALQNIVNISEYHDNGERLEWDIMKIPHHGSHKSLNKDDKGTNTTDPLDEVDQLFKKYGRRGGIMVCTSRSVPQLGDDQPPHRQAVAYYESVKAHHDGEFKITMEHPKPSRPEPLVIIIDGTGARIRKSAVDASAAITSQTAPRAGQADR